MQQMGQIAIQEKILVGVLQPAAAVAVLHAGDVCRID
jgi:hypothetical protein